MKIELSDKAVSWFKKELELPEDDKVLQFFVRYGGEFQLKQGFSPAFSVDKKADIEIGYENHFDGLDVVIAEKDLWYFEDSDLFIDVNDGIDEISYTAK
ncbi:HesB/YadR/YfhF family protein [Staphylococcus caeli]|uniref:Iron-sulfur cluster biosynthesis protein n=1 Tax=Staphylococcus caeli TaxID=2201815 RepID=A0A1D4RNK4_9STAP|nr:HesB/YadR/YfhF family protein [Staphylococcus caeli]SCT41416.1 iron-sulfur cluster biosynthesis protein [Staphylococcus caeli]SCT49066.1 iron-sulfur cluster biosynthesis protein [Staphylococcus caeli]